MAKRELNINPGYEGQLLGNVVGPRTSGAKSNTRFFRQAKEFITPDAAELSKIPGFELPDRMIVKTDKATMERSNPSTFRQRFLNPYQELFYEDYLDAAKEYYFDETSPSQLISEVDEGFQSNLESGILPKQAVTEFVSSADSPFRGLKDIKETASENLKDISEQITTEESAIQEAKDLYEDRERTLTRQRASQIESNLMAEEDIRSEAAMAGYARGPRDRRIGRQQEAGRTQLEEIQLQKERALEARNEDIEDREINLRQLYDDAEQQYKDVSQAETDYRFSAFNEFGDFQQRAQETITTAQDVISTLKNKTSSMFTAALGRAEKGGFKGGQPSFAQESVFAGAREAFESDVAQAQDNISNLEMFLPQASDVGKQEIDPFLSGGEFSYLQEGFDEDYFQDLVDM
jgi:hypothetical protein